MLFTALDFFAGSGLVTEGLSSHFDTVWANDICPKKMTVYAANFGREHFLLKPIQEVNGGELPRADLAWGYKSYSRSKPLTMQEFDREKSWWGGPGRKGHKITEHAWKVSAKELAGRNYYLDCKNPYEVEVNHRDPEELITEYQQIVLQLEAAREALKAELMACLGGKA